MAEMMTVAFGRLALPITRAQMATFFYRALS